MDELEKEIERWKQKDAELKVSIAALQESLDVLRVSVKYLVFDLEATRRENAYLQKMLAEANDKDDDNTV